MGSSSAARGPLRPRSEPVVVDSDAVCNKVGAEASSSKGTEKTADGAAKETEKTAERVPEKLPRPYVADAESEDEVARPVKKTEKLGIKDDKTTGTPKPKKAPKKRPAAKPLDPEKASSNGDDDNEDSDDDEPNQDEAKPKKTAAKSKPKSKAKAKAKGKGKAKAKGKSKQGNSSKNHLFCGLWSGHCLFRNVWALMLVNQGDVAKTDDDKPSLSTRTVFASIPPTSLAALAPQL